MATRSEGAGRVSNAAGLILANQALGMLQRIADVADRAVTALETEPDLDNSYVVGGLVAGASVQQIQLPRTLHHVELTLSAAISNVNLATAAYTVALFDGPIALAEAQQRHNVNSFGPSGAVAVSVGSSVTVRDNLTGSGILTVFFSGAATVYATVRVRDLDKTQTRASRT